MERVNEVRYSVYVNTNKQRIDKSFDDFGEFVTFLNELSDAGLVQAVHVTPGDSDVQREASAASDYLATLLNRGEFTAEQCVRLTVAWILSRGTAKGVEDAIEKLGDGDGGEPWQT